jgi:acyl-CoA hydrolase
MPRTYGENQVHLSQIVGWCEADYSIAELPARPVREADRTIAECVAERIPDGATLQAGIGSIPNEVLGLLNDHKDLGVNTELLSDGFVDLIENGVINGTRKRTHRNKTVATNALGSNKLYEFVEENPGVELWPVDHTNDDRTISGEDKLHRHQRHPRGRLPRPVRLRVAGQRVLVVVGRPAGLRTRGALL